jgi:hypothetical protein
MDRQAAQGSQSRDSSWLSALPHVQHNALLAGDLLQRKVVVYIRQSTPQQVQSNLERQRRQYDLVEVARRRGFANVDVIDDGLGRTASNTVKRPGNEDLDRRPQWVRHYDVPHRRARAPSRSSRGERSDLSSSGLRTVRAPMFIFSTNWRLK